MIAVFPSGLITALGQKQTFALHQPMSALPPIATSIAFFGMSALGQKRTHALQQTASLFDHLIRARQQRRRTVRPSVLAVLTLMRCWTVACGTLGATRHRTHWTHLREWDSRCWIDR